MQTPATQTQTMQTNDTNADAQSHDNANTHDPNADAQSHDNANTRDPNADNAYKRRNQSHDPNADAQSHDDTHLGQSHDDTISHTTMQTTQSVEFDFENDDDAFYDFIEFGIASNGGRLSIR